MPPSANNLKSKGILQGGDQGKWDGQLRSLLKILQAKCTKRIMCATNPANRVYG